MVNCIFGTEDVFVDDEAGAFRLASVSFTHLSDGSILAENVVKLISRDLVGQVSDEDYAIDFRWQARIGFDFGIHFSIKI